MNEKLLKILNELPSGDYIRIRNEKHSYIGHIDHTNGRIKVSGDQIYIHLSAWIAFYGERIMEGDTLYRIEDITSVKVKPLIYL